MGCIIYLRYYARRILHIGNTSAQPDSAQPDYASQPADSAAQSDDDILLQVLEIESKNMDRINRSIEKVIRREEKHLRTRQC